MTGINHCPFCGDGDPAIDEIEIRVWAIVCNECGCIGPVENYDSALQSPERAIELWNQRAIPPTDDHPDPLGEALNSGDGVYRP